MLQAIFENPVPCVFAVFTIVAIVGASTYFTQRRSPNPRLDVADVVVFASAVTTLAVGAVAGFCYVEGHRDALEAKYDVTLSGVPRPGHPEYLEVGGSRRLCDLPERMTLVCSADDDGNLRELPTH